MRLAVLAASLFAACGDNTALPDAGPLCTFHQPIDDTAPAPISTPRWAFRPWISKDISDVADTRAFVDGFKTRDIPVGVVVLDSPWETQYNTFVPDPVRYAGFAALIKELHAEDIRLVNWVTQMVNVSSVDFEPGGNTYMGASPNYALGKACGFFVNHAATQLWWKGVGSAVDFNNPDGVGWWHRQQDPLLDLGLDGWKLDFAEQYIGELPITTATGDVELQQYSESYYRDFYAYGRARRGADFVTMVRPYDESYNFPGRFFARPEHAPVTWVGDNRRDFVGLADALDHIFRSAQAGYVVIGSDIGGYLDRDDQGPGPLLPFDTDVFARWTAVGALCPFMQLHGKANITPWTVPDHVDETVALYRYWATLHDQLGPFWFSLAEAAYAGGPHLIRPIGADPTAWAQDWRYQLGDALLVAPILDATGVRSVALPAGAAWYDWWAPGGPALAGGTTITADATDRARIPLYVRAGAIVPLEVANDATGLGTTASAGALTVLVWPAAAPSTFTVHDRDGQTTAISASRGAGAHVALGRAVTPIILRVRVEAAPTSVSRGATALTLAADRDAVLASAGDQWAYVASDHALWIKVAASAGPITIEAITP
jgi:alpha-glucosidase (family GH31 glycosyl hydrolase)